MKQTLRILQLMFTPWAWQAAPRDQPAQKVYQLPADFELMLQVFLSGEPLGNQEQEFFRWLAQRQPPLSRPELEQAKLFRKNGGNLVKQLAHRGYPFSLADLQYFASRARLEVPELTLILTKNGHCFSLPELLEIGNPTDLQGFTPAHWMAWSGKKRFTPQEILQLGNPVSRDGYTIAYIQAQIWKAKYSLAEIQLLGEAAPFFSTDFSTPLSIYAARNGQTFTASEVLHLGNPRDGYGATLAHWLAFLGQQFTVAELLQFGDVRIKFDPNYEWWDSSSQHDMIGFDEEGEYQRKENVLHNGATIAHIMAREGARFTAEEIEQLGNPKDAAGLTLQDWMDKVATLPPV